MSLGEVLNGLWNTCRCLSPCILSDKAAQYNGEHGNTNQEDVGFPGNRVRSMQALEVMMFKIGVDFVSEPTGEMDGENVGFIFG